jgi:hypothetical protein
MIDSSSSNEEEIKKNVADHIFKTLPSAPTDYVVDFFVEEVTKSEELYEREQEIIPLFGNKPCKDTEFSQRIEKEIPKEVLELSASYLKFKEEFEDE